MSENFIIVSDTQIPFHHGKAFEFVKYNKKHFNVKDENMYHVGDELDSYWGSMYEKSIDAGHTAKQELELSKEILREWYKAFPKMKLATSNHGIRWFKKAIHAEILSDFLRKYEEVLEAPKGWQWKERWLVNTKYPFIVEHGDRFGGQFPHVQAAMFNQMSTVIGHHHSIAGVEHIETQGTQITGKKLWGACAGSLIDFEQYAFHYARMAKRKPCIGMIVIVNSGRTPIWCPLD